MSPTDTPRARWGIGRRSTPPTYAGTDCSGCGKFADECWRELQGETCCIACVDPEYNGHHIEGLDRAEYDQTHGGLTDLVDEALR